MKILQEKRKLSEESAKRYLEEAEEAIKEIDKYSVFIKSLCEIISDLKKINAGDDTIISKIQDKFHFDKDDAEFLSIMKSLLSSVVHITSESAGS